MTTELPHRLILDDGTVICDESGLVEILYSGNSIGDLYCSDYSNEKEWSLSNRLLDSTDAGPIYTNSKKLDGINWNSYWLTPEPYNSIDFRKWCIEKCSTPEEKNRAEAEIAELEKRNMVSAMKHLIYCVDVWRKNNVLWGVGRGSSVSSFILFLIGINRVNPIKYNLDFKEWLK
jgi:DNA polymerase III alpha subunit